MDIFIAQIKLIIQFLLLKSSCYLPFYLASYHSWSLENILKITLAHSCGYVYDNITMYI